MADIIWQHVTNYMSSLSTTVLAEQTDILAYVNKRALNPAMFGGEESAEYKRARIYLAAHIGMVSQTMASGQGPVTSESVGGISRSYASVGSVTDSELGKTGPGQLLLGMMVKSRGPFVL